MGSINLKSFPGWITSLLYYKTKSYFKRIHWLIKWNMKAGLIFPFHGTHHMWCLLCDTYLNCEPDLQPVRIHLGTDPLESMWNLSVSSGTPQRYCHLVLEKSWAGRILRAGSKTYHILQDCCQLQICKPFVYQGMQLEAQTSFWIKTDWDITTKADKFWNNYTFVKQ